MDPATGKLKWYYKHLPGDDWDLDHTQERILLRPPVSPDPSAVKWINPRIRRGEQRDDQGGLRHHTAAARHRRRGQPEHPVPLLTPARALGLPARL